MALLTKSGGFTSPTSTGNFDVTGLGFTPTTNAESANAPWKTLALAPAPVETTKTQTGNARIVKGIDYTLKPVVQIDKEIPFMGSYTIRPDGRAESITGIVTSEKIKPILQVQNARDDLVIFIDAVNVG